MAGLYTVRITRCNGAGSLHFSPPDGRSRRYDRQDFVALACRAQRTVQVRLRAPSGSRLVLTALSRTSPRHVVRKAGKVRRVSRSSTAIPATAAVTPELIFQGCFFSKHEAESARLGFGPGLESLIYRLHCKIRTGGVGRLPKIAGGRRSEHSTDPSHFIRQRLHDLRRRLYRERNLRPDDFRGLR